MTAVTQWFAMTKKPARRGVYQTLLPFGIEQFSYWNGTRWSDSRPTAISASSNPPGGHQNKSWRGLAVKP